MPDPPDHGPLGPADAATGLTVAAAGRPARIRVGADAPEPVRRAAADLAADLAAVCGGPDAAGVAADAGGVGEIVVGVLGDPRVDAAVAAGLVDVTPLRDGDSWRWEGYTQQVADGRLWLVGTDPRGAVFACYDLARAAGQSPWYWWADVPPRRRTHVTVAADLARFDWPDVRYRGVFLNDEEELGRWAARHTPDGALGPAAYDRVCELLLRLKGNYLWPAMHVGAFDADPRNAAIAQARGVVIGTSHCDILTRSNQHEWAPWAEAHGGVAYDFSLDGPNRSALLDYWRGGVARHRDHEVTWTLGMRGIHDSALVTAALDGAGLGPADLAAARRDLLAKAIAAQCRLLAEELVPAADRAEKVFIPYKEVLELYDAGLELPPDVTVVWVDDNFGYIRRLPGPADRARSDRHGLYYHCSYWSQPPRSYLCTSSTPLPLMRHELDRAYAAGVRRLWVNNVGGLKPLEVETEFFLAEAWAAGRDRPAPEAWLADWLDGQFSGSLGAEVAAAVTAATGLNQCRKIEHLAPGAFSQTAYGDEAAWRLGELGRAAASATAWWDRLPAGERDALAELVLVRLHLTYLVSAQFYHADRSRLCFAQGDGAGADRHLAWSRRFDALKRAVIFGYNHRLAQGRWEGMFTPQEAPPPRLPAYPPGCPALRRGLDDVGGPPRWERRPVGGGPGAGGYISLDPARPDAVTSTPTARWEEWPGLGRPYGPAWGARVDAAAGDGGAATAAYDFWLAAPSAPLLEVHRLPTLAANGRIRLGVAVDGGAPVTLESPTTDSHTGAWAQAVLDNVERLTLDLPDLTVGPHRLTLHTIDDHVGLAKLVLYTAPRQPSNLGPPFGCRDAEPADDVTDDAAEPRWADWDQAIRRIYGTAVDEPPLPDALYADAAYWTADTTYVPPVARPQTRLGPLRRDRDAAGRVDRLAAIPARPLAVGGALAWEAEAALLGAAWAEARPSRDPDPVGWSHCQAETDGGTGLALYADAPGRCWEDPAAAPALVYGLAVPEPATYRLWALLKCDDHDGDALDLAVDGAFLPAAALFSGGRLYRFNTAQAWVWSALADLTLTAGGHDITLASRRPGLKFDRFWLTPNAGWPPPDATWPRPGPDCLGGRCGAEAGLG
ncbi:MAG: glycosyl hydrolase 115 family protein [Propionibacteriaceae bacterium]|jgi:hypothetical protein|nr:glycosyl hydrolase 115 family protein [Propionibacteriaceae bacterium]